MVNTTNDTSENKWPLVPKRRKLRFQIADELAIFQISNLTDEL